MSWRLAVSTALAIAFPYGARCDGVVVNELLYDPAGSDAGHEYVEILNATQETATLDASWRLERGNGSGPDQWTVFWSGDGTRLEPGAFLVIGDDPRADRTVTPALQNGPDACRLMRDQTLVDAVGWGSLQYPEYFEGRAASDPAYGLLARRPDGKDTDINADDFVPATRETPGEINFPSRLMVITPDEPMLSPVLPRSAEGCRIGFVVRSEGLMSFEPGEAGVREPLSGAEWPLAERLSPGGVQVGTLPLPGRGAGVHEVLLHPWSIHGDAGPALRLRYRVDLGPLVFSEIQARPQDGEPEWIEIARRDGEELELAGWSVIDGSGTRGVISARPTASGRFLLFAASPGPLFRTYPALDPATVLPLEPWPALNDAGETLMLVSPDSLVSDMVDFKASQAPRGVTLERVNERLHSRDPAAWVVAPKGPTPGSPNGAHAEPPEEPSLTVTPRVVGPSGATIGFHLGPTTGRLRLVVLDAAGNERGTLLERENAAGRGGLHWDGRAEGKRLPPGLYYLVALLESDDGTRVVRRTSLAMAWEDP